MCHYYCHVTIVVIGFFPHACLEEGSIWQNTLEHVVSSGAPTTTIGRSNTLHSMRGELLHSGLCGATATDGGLVSRASRARGRSLVLQNIMHMWSSPSISSYYPRVTPLGEPCIHLYINCSSAIKKQQFCHLSLSISLPLSILQHVISTTRERTERNFCWKQTEEIARYTMELMIGQGKSRQEEHRTQRGRPPSAKGGEQSIVN
jgi:hypothetical protein